jgi:hypothetical protein
LSALLLAAALFLGAHASLDAVATFAERRLDAFLWKRQDYLRLFDGANYVNQGRGRLLIYGPSEAREGLLPEELAKGLPALKPYQHSQSWGTLEDGLIVLDYIERAWGPGAVPEALVYGITTRFIADIRQTISPLQDGIDLYSPHFRVDRAAHPPALITKHAGERLISWANRLRIQPDRYRRGVAAIAARVATTAYPPLSAERLTWEPFRPAKYFERQGNVKAWKNWLVEPGNHWEKVHNWDPEQSRQRIALEFRVLLDYVNRHHMKLFVVNLPEWYWNRVLYKPGRYESYLAIVREQLGDTPFLDLRTFLAEDEFFDDGHPTWPAARKVSARVAQFIREHDRSAAEAAGPGGSR